MKGGDGPSPSRFPIDPSGPADSPPQGLRPLVPTGVFKTQRPHFDPTPFPPFSSDPTMFDQYGPPQFRPNGANPPYDTRSIPYPGVSPVPGFMPQIEQRPFDPLCFHCRHTTGGHGGPPPHPRMLPNFSSHFINGSNSHRTNVSMNQQRLNGGIFSSDGPQMSDNTYYTVASQSASFDSNFIGPIDQVIKSVLFNMKPLCLLNFISKGFWI